MGGSHVEHVSGEPRRTNDPMKYLVFCLILPVAGAVAQSTGESLTLEECYTLAEQHYPLARQRELIAKSKEYTLSNISKGSLPQLSILGQATYQSDVTELPISFPGVDLPVLPKDQYRLYGEVNQPLTDLLTVRQNKALGDIRATIEQQNIESELYQLRERINQLYFGALLIEAQVDQNELVKKDISTAMSRVEAAINFGTELKSSLEKLKAELLRADQRSIELRSARKAYLEMLGLFINQTIDDKVELIKPVALPISQEIHRPELKAFDLQRQSLAVENKLITTRNLPKFALFLQGGFGRPSPVNFLSDEFSTYYIAGLRLSWMLTGFYTSSRERELLIIRGNQVDTRRETFLFNTNVAATQTRNEIMRLEELLATDNEIIVLRASVKKSAESQLDNGIITVNDFIREVNSEDQARQGKLLHEVQLLMAQYHYATLLGTNHK